MNWRACGAAWAVALTASMALPSVASAGEPGECVERSPSGYCVQWDVPKPGTPSKPGSSGGTAPECYWVNTGQDMGNDPTIYEDFGLPHPPDGVEIIWQSWECSDGRTTFNFRWVLAATPGNLATIARGQLVGELPQPIVESSPPEGTASIIGVPVFVTVTNWTGARSETECAGGLCVTLTATPQVVFRPGEPGASAVTCAGAGTRYSPGVSTPEAQAAATGACAWTFRQRTGVQGRPAAWPGQVSVTWTLTWTATSGATGSLAAVTRSADVPRQVTEVQTVIEGGETP